MRIFSPSAVFFRVQLPESRCQSLTLRDGILVAARGFAAGRMGRGCHLNHLVYWRVSFYNDDTV